MILIAGSVVAQDKPAQDKPSDKPGAGHDMGSGAANIGEGAGKAAGSAAKGTVKGAADLATLHPLALQQPSGEARHLLEKMSRWGALRCRENHARRRQIVQKSTLTQFEKTKPFLRC